MSDKRTNPLVALWETMKEAGEKINIAKAAKSLQRQAEIDVAEAQETAETAKDNFDKAKLDALKDRENGFKNIVKAFGKMNVEQQRLTDAIDMYESLFEEKPRLLD